MVFEQLPSPTLALLRALLQLALMTSTHSYNGSSAPGGISSTNVLSRSRGLFRTGHSDQQSGPAPEQTR